MAGPAQGPAAGVGAAETLIGRPPAAIPRSLLPPAELPYPVRYEVAYPERLSRWKTFFRLPLLLPVYLFLYLVQAALLPLFLIGWTTVFWKKKYPSWAFTGGAGAMGYVARATAYGLLQTDRFPSFDYEHPDVVLEFAPPPAGQLSRWRVFWWKVALLLPHYAVLYFLQAALAVVTILAWFGILLSGNYPRGMFAFATGVMRWHYRVLSYFASYNDRYPPFALSRDAGPAGNTAVVWSGAGGILVFGGFTAAVVAAAIVAGDADRQTVRYADLLNGRGSETLILTQTSGGTVQIRLDRVIDPGDALIQLLKPARDEKVIVFEWTVRNRSNGPKRVSDGSITFKHSGGETRRVEASLIAVDGRAAPGSVAEGTSAAVRAAFVVPKNAVPVDLRFKAGWTELGGVIYEFVN
ncbi:MAG: hypothetical protein C0506_05375 [Anaerolinea sp.]|nr:hypothetical protein [Anaerolinea sp.]